MTAFGGFPLASPGLWGYTTLDFGSCDLEFITNFTHGRVALAQIRQMSLRCFSSEKRGPWRNEPE